MLCAQPRNISAPGLEACRKSIAQMRTDLTADKNAVRRSLRLEPKRDVDRVTEDRGTVPAHLARVDPDPEADAIHIWSVHIAPGHCHLDPARGIDHGHDAWELGQHIIAFDPACVA